MSGTRLDSAHRTRVVERCDAYVDALDRGDVEAIVACFAPSAVQYEPVGTPPNTGHDAIRRYFEARSRTRLKVRRCSPVTVVGRGAVFQIHVDVDDGAYEVVSADVIEVDDDYRIVSIAAYPDRLAPADLPGR